MGNDVLAEGDSDKADQGREHCQNRSNHKKSLVDASRNQQLLGHQLNTVNGGLQKTPRTIFHWTWAPLVEPGTFALAPDQVSGIDTDKADGTQHGQGNIK